MNAISLTYAGGQVVKYGGNGGSEQILYLQEGEFITTVTGRSGGRIDKLKFITNTGRSIEGGKDRGSPFEKISFTGKETTSQGIKGTSSGHGLQLLRILLCGHSQA